RSWPRTSRPGVPPAWLRSRPSGTSEPAPRGTLTSDPPSHSLRRTPGGRGVTHFGWIDGSIVGAYLLATMVAGLMVRKYVGGVEDFLVAGREMDVHLGIASLAATEFGIVTCMYTAEAGYRFGFAGSVPGIEMALAMFVVGWTGFCIKPLREAGVITL